MVTESIDGYEIEVSAIQLIYNGAWTAYAVVRPMDKCDRRLSDECLESYQCDRFFATQEDAIAAAREAALDRIRRAKLYPVKALAW